MRRSVPILCALLPLVLGAAERPWFEDVSERVGLDFVHFNGMTGRYYFPEMMGAGAALFDMDGDGDLDIYLVQGNMMGPHPMDEATRPPQHPLPLTDRLYRNDSERDAEGRIVALRFTDVTATAGLESTTGYGMGVATGDFDDDGLVDLYLTNYGPNQLLRNLGGGRFEDVTARAGVDDPRWSVAASFLDHDRDGDLDLYVGNYVKHDMAQRRVCRFHTRELDYCGPLKGDGETDRLFENLGDGRFRDISERAGILEAYGGALGVVAADVDGDGWTDIYVANDGVANQLWMNQGDGRFVDDALFAAVSVNEDGMAEASMGVDIADIDRDGDDDIFITHLSTETNTLYVNDGQGWFEDRTVRHGLAAPSFPYTGFGTALVDLDNDGWLDILAVNGAVKKLDALVRAGDPYPLHQRDQLFRNRGDGSYEDISSLGGPHFLRSEVGRGAAFGDVDDDGDVDVLITNNAGPARLLLNRVGQDRPWIGLDLRSASGRPALGAVAILSWDGGTLVSRAHADGSYLVGNDPRITAGLGEAEGDVDVVVRWPDGSSSVHPGLSPGRYHRISAPSAAPETP